MNTAKTSNRIMVITLMLVQNHTIYLYHNVNDFPYTKIASLYRPKCTRVVIANNYQMI